MRTVDYIDHCIPKKAKTGVALDLILNLREGAVYKFEYNGKFRLTSRNLNPK